MKKFSSITRVNSRRTSQTRQRVRILIVTAVCIFVVFLIPKVILSAVAVIAVPINETKTWLAYSGTSFPQYFRDRSGLVAENSALKEQIAQAGGDKFTIDTLKTENTQLRSLLGYKDEKRIVAGIIGRPGEMPYDTLMIDRGSINGIQVGAPVYIGDNTVIGIIKTVTRTAALAELITTPGFNATVYVIGPNIYTQATGMGGGQLRIGIPQGIPVKSGDMVVMPSVTSGVYGPISVVQSASSQPEQYAFVSPVIPLSGIRFVAIGTTPMQPITFAEAAKNVALSTSTLFAVPVPDGFYQIGTSTATTTVSGQRLMASSTSLR